MVTLDFAGVPRRGGLLSSVRTRLISRHCVMLALGSVCGMGCNTAQTTSGESTGAVWQQTNPNLLAGVVFPARREDHSDAQGSGPTFALEVHFHTWKFRLPVNQMKNVERMWDHIDESAVAYQESTLLKRNGLRVGRGAESSWPPVREILLALDPQVWQSSAAMVDGQPLSLELERIEQNRPLFYFDADDKLIGSRRAQGSMCLRVSCGLDMDQIDRMLIHVVPELRSSRGNVNRRLQRAITVPSEFDVELFDQLAFSMTLTQGQYVLIGPSSASRMTHLLGSKLLRSVENEDIFENVYCIVPTIFRRRLSPGSQPQVMTKVSKDGE